MACAWCGHPKDAHDIGGCFTALDETSKTFDCTCFDEDPRCICPSYMSKRDFM